MSLGEDEKFEKLLDDKRHKEVLKKLTAIVDAARYDNVIAAINKQSEVMRDFAYQIKSLPRETGVAESVNKMALVLSNKLNENNAIVEKELAEWKFEVERDNYGHIKNIKAKQIK